MTNMRFPLLPLLLMRRYPARAARRRRGVSVVEIMVAITTLGVALSLIGRASMVVNAYNRENELKTKRNLAMQQQLNFIGALPYANLNTTNVPASKNFTTGDFSYTRRVTITTTAKATRISVTIVPQTGFAKDTLLKESLSFVRAVPQCGTVLNTQC